MSIKVSVIIPVYNSENYLEECIQSLLNQILKECEFIFINDGSTDNSYNILKKYEALDKRVLILNQENQGVSVARNNGLTIARGNFIGFVDSDDTVENEYFKTLFEAGINNNVDVVIADWNSSQQSSNYYIKQDEILNEEYIDKVLKPLLIKSDFLNSVCNKLYKREIIEKFNIRFPEGVALGEDGRFNIRFFTYANSTFYLKYSGYNYREVEGSATRNIVEKDYFKNSLEVYKDDIKEFKQWNIDIKDIDRYKGDKLINSVLSYVYLYFDSSEQLTLGERYKYVNKMIKTKEVNEVVNVYWSDICKDKGRYEQVILNCIKNKFTPGIYLATLYSRLRNR